MASVIPSQVLGVDLHEASEEELSVEGVVRVDVGQFVLPLAPLVMHLLQEWDSLNSIFKYIID